MAQLAHRRIDGPRSIDHQADALLHLARVLDLEHSIAPAEMNGLFMRHPRSLSLGHAVLCAEPLVGCEFFSVLLADELRVGEHGGPGVIAQMTATFEVAKRFRSIHLVFFACGAIRRTQGHDGCS